MPIPFLVAGAAAAAGATGAYKTTKAFINNKQAKELLEEASSIYSSAEKNLESQRVQTVGVLDELGRQRIKTWSEDLLSYIQVFDSFKNVDLRRGVATDSNLFRYCDPQEMLPNMRAGALQAKEIAQIGSAALGAGAVTGIAAYGGAMMLGHASTGVAISALHGAAAHNALLAWFGGGAKAAGGLGMAGGQFVLGGVVFAPVLAVAGIIMEAKSKEQLANAEMVYAEAEEAAAKMGVMQTTLNGISSIASDYNSLIREIGIRLRAFTKELTKIKKNNLGSDGKVDFTSLSMKDQKTLHLSWLLAQVCYQLLAAPLLDEEGNVMAEAKASLEESRVTLASFDKEVVSLPRAIALIGNPALKKSFRIINIIGSILACVLAFVAGACLGEGAFLKGIYYLMASIIACPFFGRFSGLSASRILTISKVRVIIAFIIVVLILLFV